MRVLKVTVANRITYMNAQLIKTNENKKACNWTEIASPIYNNSYVKSQTEKLALCSGINFRVIKLLINNIRVRSTSIIVVGRVVAYV